MSWHAALGGRKFIISVVGVVATVAIALVGGSSEAFVALGTIVLSYCGGNAAIEWRHAGVTQQFGADKALLGLPEYGGKTDE